MGFGLTLIGYFIAYVVSMAFPPAKLLGYALLMWGCVKLSEYNTKFKNCYWPLCLLGLVGIYSTMGYIYDLFNVTSVFFEGRALDIATNLGEAVDVAFHACILTAVCSIAKETELPKMAFASMRNLLILIVSEVAYFAALLIPVESVASVVSYVSVVLHILWVALNVLLLANCYKMICPEGDEEMPVRESNIAIIQKMDAVINKREDEAKKAAEDLVRRRRERRMNKTNKSKKKRK